MRIIHYYTAFAVYNQSSLSMVYTLIIFYGNTFIAVSKVFNCETFLFSLPRSCTRFVYILGFASVSAGIVY